MPGLPSVDIILAWIVTNRTQIMNGIRAVSELALAVRGALFQTQTQGHEGVRNTLRSELAEQKRTLSRLGEDNELQHNRMILQIEMVELIISAQTFQRFANNLDIHASNLHIHFQSLRNQAEIKDIIRRQQSALATFREAFEVLGSASLEKSSLENIRAIDLDICMRDLSLIDGYNAFEHTRDLLIGETRAFSKTIEKQVLTLDGIRDAARRVPSQKARIENWLEQDVEPQLASAKTKADAIFHQLNLIPKAMTR